jgi:hypothetical protein
VIVFGNDEELIEFANRWNPVGGRFTSENCFVVGLKVDDQIRVANAFNNFTETSVEATLVSDGSHFVNKDFIKASYIYAFHVAKKFCLNMFTNTNNEQMNRIHKKFGHRNDGVLHHWFGENEHAYRWFFTADDWQKSRWFIEL